MLALKRIAITGTISSGKSTVLSMLRSLGAYTVNADQLLHTAFSKDLSLKKQIVELFGSQALLENGEVDRAYISEKIAHQNELALQLEDICHPYLFDSLDKLYVEQVHAPELKKMFVVEVPLLFESKVNFLAWFDTVCVVQATFALSKERYVKNHQTEEQFAWRYARQLSGEEKAKRADYVIENTGSLEELKNKTQAFFDWSISTA